MRLLIVDDEPVIRQGLLKMAQMYSPSFDEISTAVNGLDALHQMRDFQPQVVITDIRMPKMDGLDLCRTLHEEYPHVQMIIISGYSDFEYAQKCIKYGIKDYLLKPVTKDDLHEAFDNYIHKPTRGYIPVSRYVQWIERMEQSIWLLQLDELNELKKQWRTHCLESNLTLEELKELLNDCVAILEKRFQERNYTPEIKYETGNESTKGIKEALDAFDRLLDKLADDLLTTRNGNFKDPMEEAKMFINNHLSQDITLEQVAGMVGLTPNYFSSLFKKITNETFVHYRIKKRMEKAKELLAVPHYRIVDVAVEVGFDDYPHFTKTFKKITGLSPSQYRSQMGIK